MSFFLLHDGISNTQDKEIQIMQRRQGIQLQTICKTSRKCKANCFILSLSNCRVYFILVSDYTIRGMIIMDGDEDDDGNNKNMIAT